MQRRGGRFGGGVLGFVGTVGQARALDAGVGVGVEQGGLASGLASVQDRNGTVAGDGGIVQQDDVLADERGVDLVEGALEADGAVLADAALEAVAEERVEIGVGADKADAGGGAGPGIERGFAVEAAVGAEMVLAFAPGGPAGVEGVEAAGVVLAEQGQELHADGAEEAFDLAASGGLVGGGVDQLDAEGGADHGQLAGAVIAPIVDVEARRDAALEQGLLEDGQEGVGVLGEGEGAVGDQARGIVEEAHQIALLALAPIGGIGAALGPVQHV